MARSVRGNSRTRPPSWPAPARQAAGTLAPQDSLVPFPKPWPQWPNLGGRATAPDPGGAMAVAGPAKRWSCPGPPLSLWLTGCGPHQRAARLDGLPPRKPSPSALPCPQACRMPAGPPPAGRRFAWAGARSVEHSEQVRPMPRAAFADLGRGPTGSSPLPTKT